jgi:hypothetical protein
MKHCLISTGEGVCARDGDCPEHGRDRDGQTFLSLEERLDRALAARGTPDSAPSVPITVELSAPVCRAATYIPQGDQERKDAPMFRGLLGYFPAALFEVASHSLVSDRKHNPGNTDGPHWARGKSADHEDCIVRHLIDAGARTDGLASCVSNPDRKYHLRALAWRALALLQEECEAGGALPGVSSRFAAGGGK